jgi:hypothetical protein
MVNSWVHGCQERDALHCPGKVQSSPGHPRLAQCSLESYSEEVARCLMPGSIMAVAEYQWRYSKKESYPKIYVAYEQTCQYSQPLEKLPRPHALLRIMD